MFELTDSEAETEFQDVDGSSTPSDPTPNLDTPAGPSDSSTDHLNDVDQDDVMEAFLRNPIRFCQKLRRRCGQ